MPFFHPDNVAAAIGPNRNVVVLPYGSSLDMIWQWQAKFGFTQSGGYIALPPAMAKWRVVATFFWGNPDVTFSKDLSEFCTANDVSAILIGPGTPRDSKMPCSRLAGPLARMAG